MEVDSVEIAFPLHGAAVVALADEIRANAEDAFAYDLELFGSLPEEFAAARTLGSRLTSSRAKSPLRVGPGPDRH
jgi:hypothetical protein